MHIACFSFQVGRLRIISFLFFLINLFILFIYFSLYCVFIAVRGLSLVVGNRGYSSLWHMSFSLRWLLLLRSMGSRHVGKVVVVYRLSCSAACGIFPDQGLNPCPLHWQADSFFFNLRGSTSC